jgi:hypothetical protein
MKIVWSRRAEHQLFTLPPSIAHGVMDAVETLANRNMGFVRRLETGELRLYGADFFVTFALLDDALVILRVAQR